MGTGAAHAHGTIVARQDLGAGAFTDIGELRDITFPELIRNAVEVSAQGDTYDHHVVGPKKRGTLQFGIWWDPDSATHDESTGLVKSWEDGQLDGWRITEPGGATLIFSGYLTNVGIGAADEGALLADCTVRPTAAHAIDST
jgi:hypothetical protein